MKIKVAESNIGRGQDVSFSFVTTAGEIDAVHDDYSFVGPIRVDGKVIYTGRDFRVSGVIECEKSFICDRCLGHFKQKQRHDFVEDFRLDTGDEDDEDSAVMRFTGDEIEIDALVRDTLLAAQPINNICQPGCRGLCPKCGADLNKGDCGCDRFVPDPRLADLQQLLKYKD